MTDVAQDRVGDVIDVEVVSIEDVPENASGASGASASETPAAQPNESPAGADIEAQLAEAIRERDEFLDMLQRTKADFANFRNRTLREQAAQRDHAAATVIDRLLSVLDAIDGARSHHPDAVEPVDAVLHPALVALGVERIDLTGEPFDPETHDAVAANDDEAEHDKLVVAEVLRPGYRCRGRLLRPAMVRVGSAEG